jgi:hypothetical protein
MAEQEKWQWQEPGRAWKGVGLYHITLTIPDRQPLLGTLDIPNGDPTKTAVKRTPLGNALVECLLDIPNHHPEVQVLHFCLMPDHLHAVLYVRRTMPTGIKGMVRGFWQGVKKLGRAYSIIPNDIRRNRQEGTIIPNDIRRNRQEGTIIPNDIRRNRQEGAMGLQEATRNLEAFAEGLKGQMGDEAYYNLHPVFTEMPFIRPMGRRTQLPNTIRYIDMNPQRLATKRLKPGFFRVQQDIVIGERSYDGVGNTTLLMAGQFMPVHVRSVWVKAAEHGDNQSLRDYKNGCVLAARKGTVMVSPFISTDEKQVMQVLLQEQLPFIVLADNGFREYYKPSDALFDACAAGRVLILSPWPYNVEKRKISRDECVALNEMAEEICNQLEGFLM